ncbi:MAG: rhodanese-like domain-containing protein [Bacteroidia bacterium]|nr:rhodanese-like domain-containing protein [Bacteroidia bacterium]
MKSFKAILTFTLCIFLFVQCKKKKEPTPADNGNQNPPQPFKEVFVDVRTAHEYQTEGHAACTINIPLDQFDSKIEELKQNDRVNLVCKSGTRAEIARQKLLQANYTKEVINHGSWQNLKCP